MKKLLFSFVMIATSVIVFTGGAVAQERETDLVRIPLNNYLQGQSTGKAEFIRKA